MKKPIIIVAALVIIAAVAVGGYILYTRNQTPKITLIKESGNIFYKAKESDSYTELFAEEMKLDNGSFIKTDTDSYARVFLPDNSLISIDQSAEIQVVSDAGKTDIQQFIGKTWNRVQTLTTGGEFKVETPNTIAAVRGTIFAVGVQDDNNSRVFGIEHVINVKNKGTSDKTQDVKETEFVDTTADDGDFKINPTDQKTIDDLKNSFWYKRNLLVDAEWEKIKDKKGQDLEKLLEEALQKLGNDYTGFKLGLPPVETDAQKIQDALADAYKISKIDEKTCATYTPAQIQNALDQVKRYKEYVSNADGIIALLTELKKDCADGKLSVQEAETLQNLVNNANGQ